MELAFFCERRWWAQSGLGSSGSGAQQAGAGAGAVALRCAIPSRRSMEAVPPTLLLCNRRPPSPAAGSGPSPSPSPSPSPRLSNQPLAALSAHTAWPPVSRHCLSSLPAWSPTWPSRWTRSVQTSPRFWPDTEMWGTTHSPLQSGSNGPYVLPARSSLWLVCSHSALPANRSREREENPVVRCSHNGPGGLS